MNIKKLSILTNKYYTISFLGKYIRLTVFFSFLAIGWFAPETSGRTPAPAFFPAKDNTVSGTVVANSSGAPLAGARITLFTPDLNFFREARSNAQGDYLFNDVPSGNYQLGVAARSYEYGEVTVTVADSPIIKSFRLDPETQKGRWSIIGDTAPEVLEGTGTGTLMPNGEVFYCHDTEGPVIFDPIARTKRFPLSSDIEAHGHAQALLTNGDIFFAGGGDGFGGGPRGGTLSMKASKVYHPGTNTWTVLADMKEGRWYPSIVRLPDERLLVMGGDNGSDRTSSAEIYDPPKKTWTVIASMKRKIDMPPAVLLYTGEVLKTWRDAELYNIESNAWRDTGPMLQERIGRAEGGHSDHCTLMLPDGRVMVAGIEPTSDNTNPSFIEIYDPQTNSWSRGSSPARNTKPVIRRAPEVMMLPGGKLLVYGGQYTGVGPSPVELRYAGSVPNCTNVTDLYDPETNTWRPLADMNRFIHYHSLGLLLPDGRVIDTNGAGDGGPAGLDNRIEAFEPPYLFRGVRPKIESLATTDLSAGGTFSLEVSRTQAVTEVVLIGTRAVTHWIDSGPNRYLSLNFVQNGLQVQATVPNDPVKALQGWYLLFAMVDDIPSEGRVVRILPNRSVSVESTSLTLPSNYDLQQNYPNPFNPQTRISFTVRQDHWVSLKIYNQQGQWVRTLVNEKKLAGEYTISWDGKDDRGFQLPSGIYIYQLNVEGFVSAKKAVLLK
jgi:hypothetical protein